MRTVEDVKALPGYAGLKNTLIDLKVSAYIYVSTDYLEGSTSIPIILVNTVNPKAIFKQVQSLMPEFKNEEPGSMSEDRLGFIPAFFYESNISDLYAFVEEVKGNA